jgi:hypothetical protein
MKRRVGLVGAVTPFQTSAFRQDVELLSQELLRSGAEVEAVLLPFSRSADLRQIASFRMIRQQEDYDVLIALNWPAHVLCHRRKLVWQQDPFGYRAAFVEQHPQGAALLDSIDKTGLRDAAAIYRTEGARTWLPEASGGPTPEMIVAPGAWTVAGALDWTAAVERACA